MNASINFHDIKNLVISTNTESRPHGEDYQVQTLTIIDTDGNTSEITLFSREGNIKTTRCARSKKFETVRQLQEEVK